MLVPLWGRPSSVVWTVNVLRARDARIRPAIPMGQAVMVLASTSTLPVLVLVPVTVTAPSLHHPPHPHLPLLLLAQYAAPSMGFESAGTTTSALPNYDAHIKPVTRTDQVAMERAYPVRLAIPRPTALSIRNTALNQATVRPSRTVGGLCTTLAVLVVDAELRTQA